MFEWFFFFNFLQTYFVTNKIELKITVKHEDSHTSRTSEMLASPQIDLFSTSGLSSRDVEKARRKHDKVKDIPVIFLQSQCNFKYSISTFAGVKSKTKRRREKKNEG